MNFNFLSRIVMLLVLPLSQLVAQEDHATEIVRKSDELMQGDSYVSKMTMTIVRPTWERSITFKSWGKGRDLALTYIQSPASDKGQTFLKRKNEMWTWNPKISRLIKLPPSMLAQGWMGSDYSNDDILKESSIVVDYHHSVKNVVDYEGYTCWVVEMKPKEDAAVVWSKIVSYIAKEKYFPLKVEYYNEDNELVKSHLNSDVQMVDGREIPTKTVVQPADEPNKKTVVVIDQMEFDVPIKDQFFSQQNMKRVR
ncbi:MAG: outer membrane lipoprotein-sorting protein [Salinivirgaceae bacterium]|jgi:outer membrane lipoprotein-sorting protein